MCLHKFDSTDALTTNFEFFSSLLQFFFSLDFVCTKELVNCIKMQSQKFIAPCNFLTFTISTNYIMHLYSITTIYQVYATVLKCGIFYLSCERTLFHTMVLCCRCLWFSWFLALFSHFDISFYGIIPSDDNQPEQRFYIFLFAHFIISSFVEINWPLNIPFYRFHFYTHLFIQLLVDGYFNHFSLCEKNENYE